MLLAYGSLTRIDEYNYGKDTAGWAVIGCRDTSQN